MLMVRVPTLHPPVPTTADHYKNHCQTPSKTCLFLNNLLPGGFGVLRPANAHDPGLTSTDHYPTTSTHDRPLTTIPDRFLNSWRESRDIERRFPQKHGLEGLAAAGLLSHARLGVHGLSIPVCQSQGRGWIEVRGILSSSKSLARLKKHHLDESKRGTELDKSIQIVSSGIVCRFACIPHSPTPQGAICRASISPLSFG